MRIAYVEDELTVALAMDHAGSMFVRAWRGLGAARSTGPRVDPDGLRTRPRLRLG